MSIYIVSKTILYHDGDVIMQNIPVKYLNTALTAANNTILSLLQSGYTFKSNTNCSSEKEFYCYNVNGTNQMIFANKDNDIAVVKLTRTELID